MSKKKSLGFTLIELLVATAITITTTTVVVAILASSFRSVNKTSVSEDLRQSGNSAMSRMSRLIQFADSFQGASDGVIDDVSGYDTVCDQTKSYQHIKIKSSGIDKILSCANLTVKDDVVGASATSFIDPAKVLVSNCRFMCVQGNNSPPIIRISFSLSRASAPVGEKSIDFSTSAKMRNQ